MKFDLTRISTDVPWQAHEREYLAQVGIGTPVVQVIERAFDQVFPDGLNVFQARIWASIRAKLLDAKLNETLTIDLDDEDLALLENLFFSELIRIPANGVNVAMAVITTFFNKMMK